jgi:serine/threonine protein kinase
MIDPAGYERATELFARAVDLPREERSSYLQRQCGNDSELLRLLESLLREDENGPILAGSGAPQLANEDGLSGRTVSHYLIDRPISAGGMGVVYRATETRLQRPVVLKFLPPFLTADPAIRKRFLREARAIASIDHQNVCRFTK